MGKMLLFLVFGAILAFGTIASNIHEKLGFGVDNAVTHFERATTRNMNLTVIQLAMRELQGDLEWRDGFYDLDLDGGTTTLTLQDSVVGGDPVAVIYSTSIFGQDTATSIVVVESKLPAVPGVVRGAMTAFGPTDYLVSDMFLDGRNHDANNVVIPGAGVFGVSTGMPTFTNIEPADIGGTDNTTDPPTDIPPAYPEDPLVIETNSSWPDGWPMTPDEALRLSDGTLKEIAMSGAGGSRYIVADENDEEILKTGAPIRGITYVEVPPGTEWRKAKLKANPEGILIFHSSDTDAFINDIKVVDGSPFKGLMIIDRIFHIHMDILGGLVHISPNTVVGDNCNGNQDHWINYSEETIRTATELVNNEMAGSWKDKLKIVSWWE